MPDEGTEAQEATTTTVDAPSTETEPKTFDAEYVRQLRAEAAKNRKEAQEAKARAQEYEDRDKSETEKLTGKVTNLTDENKSLKGENLRLRVAIDKKLPADLIDRLRGDTKEELEADAESLLQLVNNNKPEPTPEFDGGARETAPTPKTPEQEHQDFLLGLLGGRST